ncbi:hypothetical protein [Cohnella zeiphila]|uniref:Uncharacterized protein n=1 Tax=Cohnella zeiphila TaxID=2761120 RepID=A0A7X0SPU7_9BACL|nr:hypothetical protein [Cohnella zeiphila]MBB6733864.1 hypothetical protein [Cohnella zeiphila]
MGSLKLSRGRSRTSIRRLVVFRFPVIFPGRTVVTGAFRTFDFLGGEVVVSQRPAAGSREIPRVNYQIVNAVTGLPVTNSVTLVGTRIEVLRFIVPAGTFRLRIRNIGLGAVTVSGTIITF